MKILLPVDGSSASLAGVRHALALRAAGLPASFVLVNVQEPPSLYEVVVAHDAEVLSDVRRAAGAELLVPAEVLPPGELPDADYPMILTTGRTLDGPIR